MSNIFTYEIDERNLRIQLKGMTSPAREDSWARFEAYQIEHPHKQPATKFTGLQVNLNRNVVLPFVFGVIIIMFSLLLVNFISIKDTDTSAEVNVPKTTVTVEPAPNTAAIATPDVKKQEPAPDADLSAAGPVETVPPAQTDAAPVQAEHTVPALTVTEQNITTPVTESKIEPVASEPVVKRRSRKKVDVEEQLRPTTVADETEVEIPN